MSVFFTVIVSNDESFGWGMSTEHDASPAVTAATATAHVFTLFVIIFSCALIFICCFVLSSLKQKLGPGVLPPVRNDVNVLYRH
jgi:hypothetical protein